MERSVLTLLVVLLSVAAGARAAGPVPVNAEEACSEVDPRRAARDHMAQAFHDCTRILGTQDALLVQYLPKLVRQHSVLIRSHLAERDARSALLVHLEAMDLFDRIMRRNANLRTKSTRAAVLLREYFLLSQKLRQVLPRSHREYPRVEQDAFARPLILVSRMLDARGALTQQLRDRFMQMQGSLEGPRGKNLFGLPVKADPVDMLLVGLEETVEQYVEEDDVDAARELVDTVRVEFEAARSERSRYAQRVRNRLERMERRLPRPHRR